MDMNNIMEQVEIIKSKVEKLKAELKKAIVQGEDDNKLVTAFVNGQGEIEDYTFNFDRKEGIEQSILINALTQASNDGIKKAKQMEGEKKQEIIGDLNIPDIPGIL